MNFMPCIGYGCSTSALPTFAYTATPTYATAFPSPISTVCSQALEEHFAKIETSCQLLPIIAGIQTSIGQYYLTGAPLNEAAIASLADGLFSKLCVDKPCLQAMNSSLPVLYEKVSHSVQF